METVKQYIRPNNSGKHGKIYQKLLAEPIIDLYI